MRPDSFALLQALLKQESGLVVTADKGYLLDSRLLPLAARSGLRDLDELAARLRDGRDPALRRAVVEAMTTNESFFFRDVRPFDQFRQVVLPRLIAARAATRRLRLWSAACSTGQEPYSLAMILADEAPRLAGWTVEILGTDLSHEVVERARAGRYSEFEIRRGLPPAALAKHFRQVGDRWEISAALRRMVTFRTFNLLHDLTPLGSFDVVFCRNVLIYFDQPTKARVLAAIARRMPADGVLFLGGAETVIGVTDRFRPVDGQRGLYQPAEALPLRPAV